MFLVVRSDPWQCGICMGSFLVIWICPKLAAAVSHCPGLCGVDREYFRVFEDVRDSLTLLWIMWGCSRVCGVVRGYVGLFEDICD